MNKSASNHRIILTAGIILVFCSNAAFAYWLWTPETKKFVNPKYAVKDSPKEQFDWAKSFYTAKDYQRSATEFEKLVKNYEYSEYAADAQYYAGLSYENMGKFYIAYQNYQKAVENFPHIGNLDEIIAREFNIANFYATKDNPKVLGMEIMMALDRAIEIYKKVVDNAPYGRLADESQFSMGEAMKKAERYDEAIQAFQKVVDDYPNSKYADKAKYESAYCAYKASLKPAYDSEPTDKAIKAFQDFAETNQDRGLSKEADKTIQRLKDKGAEKSMITARFYESQRHYEAAIIYYKDVLDKFPDCSFANEARSKIDKLSAIVKSREEAQQNGSAAKGWNPINLINKPKPKQAPPVTAEPNKVEKKPWKPFSFAGPVKKKEPKPAEEAKTQKKPWTPIKFANKPKPKATPAPAVTAETSKVEKVKEAPPTQEAVKEADKGKEGGIGEEKGQKGIKGEEKVQEVVKVDEKASVKKEKKPWKPFSFAGPVKKKEPKPAEEAKTQKKPWAPLSFATPAKKKEPVEKAQAPKAEKVKIWNPLKFTNKPKPTEKPKTQKKPWTPLSFANKPKPKEADKAQEGIKGEEKVQEVVKVDEKASVKKEKKGWSPLNFTTPAKKKTAEEEAPKAVRLKGWTPLNFTDKPKVEKAPAQTEEVR